MELLPCCLLPAVMLILHCVFSKESSNKWIRLKTDDIYGTPISVEPEPLSASQCLAKCSATTGCECVNVHRENLQCELSDHPLNSLSQNQRLGWTVYCKSECPKAYLPFQQSCYIKGTNSQTFTDAMAECSQHGANLVHIDDATESQFIKNQGVMWIGLIDAQTDTNNPTRLWTWIDNGTPAQFFDWDFAQPNNVTEKCVMSGGSGGWSDYPCSHFFNTMCEKKKNY